MARLTLSLVLAGALAGCKAPPPSSCQQYQGDPLDNLLSFKTYEELGISPEAWRADLSVHLRQSMGLPVVGRPVITEPTITETTTQDGLDRIEYEVPSLFDNAPVPFAIVEPDPSIPPKRHIVMLLHGHGETWDAPFEADSEMHDVGGRLLEEGYAVAAIEIRSFGEFLIDGLNHDEYLAIRRDGTFLGEAIVDTYTAALAIQNRSAARGDRISILGHSLGGYIALHVGALTEGFTDVMSSGFFVPYACINTDYHHDDPPGVEGFAEFYDTAGMMSPGTMVDFFFGRLDLFFSVAVLELYDELSYIFLRTGAPNEPGLYVTQGIAHEVDPEKVVEALSKL